MNKNKFLERYDECPKGKNLEPGSPKCRKCKHFINTEWVSMDPEGYHLTECNYE